MRSSMARRICERARVLCLAAEFDDRIDVLLLGLLIGVFVECLDAGIVQLGIVAVGMPRYRRNRPRPRLHRDRLRSVLRRWRPIRSPNLHSEEAAVHTVRQFTRSPLSVDFKIRRFQTPRRSSAPSGNRHAFQARFTALGGGVSRQFFQKLDIRAKSSRMGLGPDSARVARTAGVERHMPRTTGPQQC